jgi:DNA-directed RNA polymerase beta subunit
MPFQVANNLRFRRSFGRIKRIIDLPYLIEIQKNSYELFLQKDSSSAQRENIGLQDRYFQSRISMRQRPWNLSAIVWASLNTTLTSVTSAA